MDIVHYLHNDGSSAETCSFSLKKYFHMKKDFKMAKERISIEQSLPK